MYMGHRFLQEAFKIWSPFVLVWRNFAQFGLALTLRAIYTICRFVSRDWISSNFVARHEKHCSCKQTSNVE
jgi:hypothetical protein